MVALVLASLKHLTRTVALLYIFANRFNIWLNVRHLNSHICFCSHSIYCNSLVEVWIWKKTKSNLTQIHSWKREKLTDPWKGSQSPQGSPPCKNVRNVWSGGGVIVFCSIRLCQERVESWPKSCSEKKEGGENVYWRRKDADWTNHHGLLETFL